MYLIPYCYSWLFYDHRIAIFLLTILNLSISGGICALGIIFISIRVVLVELLVDEVEILELVEDVDVVILTVVEVLTLVDVDLEVELVDIEVETLVLLLVLEVEIEVDWEVD